MPSNTTSRGNLNEERKPERKRASRPPLFVSDEKGAEHDATYSKARKETAAVAEDKPMIPHVFELILPLSVCIGGAVVASVYHIQWLLMVSCVIAGIAVVIYFINSRRRARYRVMSDKANMEEQVADYRRDLMKTLEGYDVDRGMTNEEIEALVDEYRHHLEVENASLANVNIIGVIAALIRRNRKGGESRRGRAGRRSKKKETGRGGLSDE